MKTSKPNWVPISRIIQRLDQFKYVMDEAHRVTGGRRT